MSVVNVINEVDNSLELSLELINIPFHWSYLLIFQWTGQLREQRRIGPFPSN